MERKKLVPSLVALFLINIVIILLFSNMVSAHAAVYKQGSSGDMVRQIQTKLKNWGYYSGEVDGIYGSGTTRAVKYFQQKNGLTADGIVGNATLQALGIVTSSSGGSSATGQEKNEEYLLARIISAESRGEPYSGQVAVGRERCLVSVSIHSCQRR